MSDKDSFRVPLPWCRLYSSEFLNDTKIKRIRIKTGVSYSIIRGIYVTLLAMAGCNKERTGEIMLGDGIPLDEDEIFDFLDLDPEIAEPVLDWMEKLKMIKRFKSKPWMVVNFAARNPPSDARGRYVKEHRKRKKEEEGRAPDPLPPANPAKDKQSAIEEAGVGQKNSTPVDRLMQHFTQETGFFPSADPTTTELRWEAPIVEWLKLAKDDEELVADWITRAVDHNRSNNYAYTRPFSIDRAVRKIAGQDDLQADWKLIKDLMLEFGANNRPDDLAPHLEQVIEMVGGWRLLCGLNINTSWEKFSQAYAKVSHERRTTNPGRS